MTLNDSYILFDYMVLNEALLKWLFEIFYTIFSSE